MTRLLLLLTLTISAFGLSGCFDSSPDEQMVPWSRPADWERGAPGFGG
ncbi:MAG: hypothetical protein ACPG3X_07460 [Opitutales bacterium]